MTLPIALVLDDDPIFREILKSVLSALGLSVTVTPTSAEFFGRLEEARADLHIVDLVLKGESGLDVIRELRLRNPHATIIAVSGKEGSAALADAIEVGADDFIVKPLERTALAAKLSLYVQTRSMKAQLTNRFAIPAGAAPVALELNATILEIDELGVTFTSPHFITKWTEVKLSLAVLDEGLKDARPIPLIVTQSDFLESDSVVRYHAEFVDPTTEFIESLRLWASAPDAG